jgi:chaperone required for assembly of F1-ATPase
MRNAPVKRFYQSAAVEQTPDGYGVLLDGRPLKTPAMRALLVPARALADAIAGEWNAQGETLNHQTLPLTKLANTAIDGVLEHRADVVDEVVRYGTSDALFYRAAAPESLTRAQRAAWDPIVAWAGREFGAEPNTTVGVTYREQPQPYLDALRQRVEAFDLFGLAALHTLTALSGSALVALAHCSGHLDAAQAWAAAHVDEDWQMSQWGEDYEARVRRERRYAEFGAASRFYNLASCEESAAT